MVNGGDFIHFRDRKRSMDSRRDTSSARHDQTAASCLPRRPRHIRFPQEAAAEDARQRPHHEDHPAGNKGIRRWGFSGRFTTLVPLGTTDN